MWVVFVDYDDCYVEESGNGGLGSVYVEVILYYDVDILDVYFFVVFFEKFDVFVKMVVWNEYVDV